jgi:hypothetical protein
MTWPPAFSKFDLVDERMTLLSGSRTPRDPGKAVPKEEVRHLESGTPRAKSKEECHSNDATATTPTHDDSDDSGGSQQNLDLTGRSSPAKPATVHLKLASLIPPAPPHHNLHSSPSFTSSTTTLMPDKVGVLDMPPQLPEKRYCRWFRNLRWTILNVYRRLNLLVLLPNVIVMLVLGIKHNLLRLSPQSVTTAVAANIAASVLIRQELLINLLFIIFGNAPKCLPLRIRRLSAKIYHLGGVHSGAGIAAVVWFGIFNHVAVNIPQSTLSGSPKAAVWAIIIILDTLLVSILVLAEPHLRAKQHNLFEMVHRFAGWTAVGLFWALFIVLSNAQRDTLDPRPSMSETLIKAPPFWLLVIITLSLIFPWLQLRRVPVHAEPLSDHAIRLHFTHTNAPLCSAPRMSDNPWKEWHAFAGIPEEDGSGFSVIVSKAGDWTANIVRNPPTHIWVRGMPTRGVLHVAKIFRKLVLVATGSGIGPILSLLYARNLDCRILWSTPDPETTYKKTIIDHVRRGDPEAIIINTTVSGRPNLIQYAYELYKSSDAEAVFIISNPRVTRKFVYALESRGVPTFAPIFDS